MNDGFGGEKKRLEILQMLLLKPAVGLLDETDSGLDIDALRIVAKHQQRQPQSGLPHHHALPAPARPRQPHFVHVMIDGTIVESGGPELALKLENRAMNGSKQLRRPDHEQRSTWAVSDYQFGFHDPENATIRFDKGLSEQVVRDISALKTTEWMTDINVKAYITSWNGKCQIGAIAANSTTLTSTT